jgi:hypothetical protein
MAMYGSVPASQPPSAKRVSLLSMAGAATAVVAVTALLLIVSQPVLFRLISPVPHLKNRVGLKLRRKLMPTLRKCCPHPDNAICSVRYRGGRLIVHTATTGIAVCAVCTKRIFILFLYLFLLRQAQQSILSNIDKDDGSDALVNAILVARGDALPTQFAGKITNCLCNLIYC